MNSSETRLECWSDVDAQSPASPSFGLRPMDALTQQTCTDSEHTPFAIRLSGVSKSFANAGEPLQVLREVDLTVRE